MIFWICELVSKVRADFDIFLDIAIALSDFEICFCLFSFEDMEMEFKEIGWVFFGEIFHDGELVG
jgi:hypothetical protein